MYRNGCYPSAGMRAHSMTFSSRKDPGAPTPSRWFPLESPPTLKPPPPHRPVTREGVRGLIICTDPGLSPQGGCLGTVALDPIDTVRGRGGGGACGGGGETDPGSSQSALLGRLMNVQDFTIFATQASGVRLQ